MFSGLVSPPMRKSQHNDTALIGHVRMVALKYQSLNKYQKNLDPTYKLVKIMHNILLKKKILLFGNGLISFCFGGRILFVIVNAVADCTDILEEEESKFMNLQANWICLRLLI